MVPWFPAVVCEEEIEEILAADKKPVRARLITLNFTRSNCLKQSRTWSTSQVLNVLEFHFWRVLLLKSERLTFAIAPRLILGGTHTANFKGMA